MVHMLHSSNEQTQLRMQKCTPRSVAQQSAKTAKLSMLYMGTRVHKTSTDRCCSKLILVHDMFPEASASQ
jgi:hypothetical protein